MQRSLHSDLVPHAWQRGFVYGLLMPCLFTPAMAADIYTSGNVDRSNSVNADWNMEVQADSRTRFGISQSGAVTVQNGKVMRIQSKEYSPLGHGYNLHYEDLTLGHQAQGTMSIRSGGGVANKDGVLGYYSDGVGVATLDGSGSRWINSGSLLVGRSGTGTLNIRNNALVQNSDKAYLGYYATSAGTSVVRIDSGGTWNTTTGLYIGGKLDRSGNSGSVRVSDGTLNVANGTLKLWETGSLTQMGGTITAKHFDASLGSFHQDSGTLIINNGNFDDGRRDLQVDTDVFGASTTLTLRGSQARADYSGGDVYVADMGVVC